jgi:hypothetical protein
MNKDKIIDEMLEWFYENYEDPANGVPYDGREGGYIYTSGGPYDPEEELEKQFPNVSSDYIKEACDRIYPEGFEWIKIGQY